MAVDRSQNGESTIVAELFTKIEPTSRYVVEFGSGDGWTHSNARMFLEDGWAGQQWDSDIWVTAENVNSLFAAASVPHDVDFVSIDIDGNDYWVWKAMAWKPKVVCIEYNAWFPIEDSVTIAYDARNIWDHSYGYSASLTAMLKLAETKGYFLAAEVVSVNLIFVRNDYLSDVPAIDHTQIPLGWRHWVDRGRACTKTFVEV
jgi:hypothetical protein